MTKRINSTIVLAVGLVSATMTAIVLAETSNQGGLRKKKKIDVGSLDRRSVKAGVLSNEVEITEDGTYRYVTSNGIPEKPIDYKTSKGCPNEISAQSYKFKMKLNATKSGAVSPSGGTVRLISRDIGMNMFGVGLDGVPFDPAANEWWDPDNPSKPSHEVPAPSTWSFEAMTGKLFLGTDSSNAHVQPTGAYHYHGPPTRLVDEGIIGGMPTVGSTTPKLRKSMTLLGYAADGFPVYSCYVSETKTTSNPNVALSAVKTLKSSYQLRNDGGVRASGEPTGRFEGGRTGSFTSTNYDGTFTQDFEYVAGSGDLDECNGKEGVTPEYPKGTYYYVVTEEFPFIPRKWRGTPLSDGGFLRTGKTPTSMTSGGKDSSATSSGRTGPSGRGGPGGTAGPKPGPGGKPGAGRPGSRPPGTRPPGTRSPGGGGA